MNSSKNKLNSKINRHFKLKAKCICLESDYFVENFLLKVLKIKTKVIKNCTVELINNIKECSGTMNSSKNKLNSKII